MYHRFHKLSVCVLVAIGMSVGCSDSREPVSERMAKSKSAPRYEAESTKRPVKEAVPVKHKRTKRASPAQSRAMLASNHAPDDPLYPMPQISLDEIRMHVENKSAVVLDARHPDDFAAGHVQGAINVPAGDMEQYVESELKDVARDQFIIIYCQSAACHSSDMLFEYMLGQGFSNMRVYRPGWQILAKAKDLQ